VLSQIKNSMDALGQPYPDLIYTDSCCHDRAMVHSHFPHLKGAAADATPKRRQLPQIQLPEGRGSEVEIVHIKRDAEMEAHCAKIYRSLDLCRRSEMDDIDILNEDLAAQNETRTISFDCEWPSQAITADGRPQLHLHQVTLVQLGIPVDEEKVKFRVYLFQLVNETNNRFRSRTQGRRVLPLPLKEILSDPRIQKVGWIGGGIKSSSWRFSSLRDSC
jgi:hypothetical protein